LVYFSENVLVHSLSEWYHSHPLWIRRPNNSDTLLYGRFGIVPFRPALVKSHHHRMRPRSMQAESERLQGQVGAAVLLPEGLHLCLPNRDHLVQRPCAGVCRSQLCGDWGVLRLGGGLLLYSLTPLVATLAATTSVICAVHHALPACGSTHPSVEAGGGSVLFCADICGSAAGQMSLMNWFPASSILAVQTLVDLLASTARNHGLRTASLSCLPCRAEENLQSGHRDPWITVSLSLHHCFQASPASW
jgi:hypothetical protein